MIDSDRIEFNDKNLELWTTARGYFKTQIERIPNPKDSDYFDLYENLNWRPEPWYNRFFNFLRRFIYFITGPKFVLPILGFVIKRSKQYIKYIES